ncbi:MAG: hypothetical protein LW729_00680, partial [Bacteroidetes bacterium]|nr:hypothetical protein [Bacteroidota bacterium]
MKLPLAWLLNNAIARSLNHRATRSSNLQMPTLMAMVFMVIGWAGTIAASLAAGTAQPKVVATTGF